MDQSASHTKMKVAILDMYNGMTNLGMQAIREIVERHNQIEYQVFDVRQKCEIPGLDFDLFISSGGPGSPLEGDGIWERGYFHLMNRIWQYNQFYSPKKYGFFICHSFQMICHFLSLGSIIRRKSQSLGAFPVHLTEYGKQDPLLADLPDPFYVADSRRWQFIQRDPDQMKNLGCKVLAIEKKRPHIPHERAIMAIRFSPEWIGVQFHPEAHPDVMLARLKVKEIRDRVVGERGEKRYQKILESIEAHSDQMRATYNTILPRYIENCLQIWQASRATTAT